MREKGEFIDCPYCHQHIILSNFCPECGGKLFKKCSKCGKDEFIGNEYCDSEFTEVVKDFNKVKDLFVFGYIIQAVLVITILQVATGAFERLRVSALGIQSLLWLLIDIFSVVLCIITFKIIKRKRKKAYNNEMNNKAKFHMEILKDAKVI